MWLFWAMVWTELELIYYTFSYRSHCLSSNNFVKFCSSIFFVYISLLCFVQCPSTLHFVGPSASCRAGQSKLFHNLFISPNLRKRSRTSGLSSKMWSDFPSPQIPPLGAWNMSAQRQTKLPWWMNNSWLGKSEEIQPRVLCRFWCVQIHWEDLI